MASKRPLPQVSAHGSLRFLRAAALTLVPVLALGAGIASALRTQADRWVLSAGRQQAAAMATMAVAPHLDGRPLSQGLTDDQRTALLRSAAPLTSKGTVFRLRLRALDGSVVFDASKPTAGSIAHPVIVRGDAVEADEMAEAVEHRGLVEVTRLNRDAIDGGAGDHAVLGARAIESYEPLVSANGAVVGLAELYLPYAPIASAAETLLRRLGGLSAVGLVLLWGALILLFTSSNRRAVRFAEHHRHLALHDVLTELPNRALFRQRADEAVALALEDGSQVAVAIVDIDRFKEINDTLGHHNGDAYLVHAARQLSILIGDRGTVARLGGDEFGIVFPGSTPERLRELGEGICAALRTPVELDSVPVSAECSIGIAVWPVHGTEVDALLRNADSAMYAAKQGRLGAIVYNGEMTHFSRSRLTLVSELRRAIRDDELVLFYQPKIRMSSGAVESVEALVRWVHPTRGFLPPSEFLPMAESTGLIDDLSRWVIRTAVAQLAEWGAGPGAAGTMPAIAINLSARNLRDGSIAAYIFATLRSREVAADRLIVEITETAYLEDPERSSVVLMELREAGVRVSLDDFGQGYTSLGHLGQLPLAELKIDRSFVNFMASDTRHRQIVESVVNLGHELGLSVVAEGVETDDQQAMLAAMGCDTVQGYLHARPQPPEVLVEWLRARAEDHAGALTAAGEGEHLLGL